MKKKIYIILTLLCVSVSASAQKWSVSTNAVEWLNFGTINVQGSVAVARHWTVNAEARYNPWTFNKKDASTQLQNRHQTYAVGVKLWPWYIYSGWWFGGKLQYQEYNRGGILSARTEEGDAFGVGLSAGYSLMIHEHINLDFGAGFWGGYKAYTAFACPQCGRITDSGSKWFIMPNDLIVAVVFTF